MTAHLTRMARAIRVLSIDAIAQANSGHPGMPLGCADIMACLYSNHLIHHPQYPDWPGRDRFILSAGHGSMALYSTLHLAGYKLSRDDLRQFRQLHSKTPGHPEYGETPGVEATTGPLGQGIGIGVGLALAHHHQTDKYQWPHTPHTYILAGDGCLMEGIGAEASALAGHLKLSELTLIYDSNAVCLDGPTKDCLSEDISMRYKAYGWQVYVINGHDYNAINTALLASRAHPKPSLIIAKTTIGYGSPVSGTSGVHGKPLTAEEIKQTKQFHHSPEDRLFYVDPKVYAYFQDKLAEQDTQKARWEASRDEWQQTHARLAKKSPFADQMQALKQLTATIKTLVLPADKATRASSGVILQHIADTYAPLIGGSADLSCSDNTALRNHAVIRAGSYAGSVIKYGVREFAMAAMSNGLALYGNLLVYMGTFLTFSDYCRNAIRLAALMKLRVIYQFTHDSVLLGEDGPTHQPIEHIASLRAMPHLQVDRPADQTEVKAAWIAAIQHAGPTALILSRQAVPDNPRTTIAGALCGGYALIACDAPDCVLIATGSEVSLAQAVYDLLLEKNVKTQLVSLPCFERFNQQSDAYKARVLPDAALSCAIEAGSAYGWHQYVGKDGLIISVDDYGYSAPQAAIADLLGFTSAAIFDKIMTRLAS